MPPTRRARVCAHSAHNFPAFQRLRNRRGRSQRLAGLCHALGVVTKAGVRWVPSRSFACLRRSRSVNVLVETAVMGTSVRPPRTGGAVKRTTLLHISTVVIGIATLAWIGSRHGIAIVRPSTEREIAKRRDPQVVTVEWHRAVVELFVVRIARKIGNSGRRSPGAGAATYVVSFGRRGWRMEARTFLSTTSCWRSFWCW
jgi:hypothetical protein